VGRLSQGIKLSHFFFYISTGVVLLILMAPPM